MCEKVMFDPKSCQLFTKHYQFSKKSANLGAFPCNALFQMRTATSCRSWRSPALDPRAERRKKRSWVSGEAVSSVIIDGLATDGMRPG